MAFDFQQDDVEDLQDVELSDASDYQDQTDPAPLEPGNYRFQVVDAKQTTNQDGEPILDNGYPQLSLDRLIITEPEEFKGREIYPFQKYSTRPIQGGKRKGAVPAVDLLRGFDDQLTFKGTRELLTLIAEKATNGGSFVASTNWLAKDGEYIKEQLDANGGFEQMDPEERQKMFNAAIFRGQKKFPLKNGVRLSEVVGPSGDTLPARVSLTRIFPASKEVKKMGPFSKKAAK